MSALFHVALIALHPRLRADAGERLGLRVAAADVGCIWVHASSLGEVSAGGALARAIQGPVVLTADTDTGARRAREIATAIGPRVVASARPADAPPFLAPLWARARPRALVFIEGAYWPGLAAMARRQGVPVLRVSGKAGQGTRRLAGPWYGRWVRPVEAVLARDPGEAAWFASHTEAAVELGADLKGARFSPSPVRFAEPPIVGASTQPGDEARLLDAWRTLDPRPPLVLAPRRPERFDEVWAWLRAQEPGAVRRSASSKPAAVLLLDTMGELAGLLSQAAAVVVGGTFDPALGGHSAAEAARAGVPIVHGPHIHANASSFIGANCHPVDDGGLAAALESALRSTRAPATADPAPAAAQWVEAHALVRASASTPPRLPLRGLSGLWGLGTDLRVGLVERGLRREIDVGVPVFCVGSSHAAGSGKTTVARWLTAQLAARGHRVGVALRGYGRTNRGGVRLSTRGAGAEALGDEGALHVADGHLVAAGADRVGCARALVEAGASAIVLDDGLQHRRLARVLDLAVVDGDDPWGGGLLPAGSRRERELLPSRAHGVVLVDGDRYACSRPVLRARRVSTPWMRAGEPSEPPPGAVGCIAGVGRPGRVLRDLNRPLARSWVLPDHAPIGSGLADELLACGLPLVCTAKDALRMPPQLRDRVWSRDVRLHVSSVPRWLERALHAGGEGPA